MRTGSRPPPHQPPPLRRPRVESSPDEFHPSLGGSSSSDDLYEKSHPVDKILRERRAEGDDSRGGSAEEDFSGTPSGEEGYESIFPRGSNTTSLTAGGGGAAGLSQHHGARNNNTTSLTGSVGPVGAPATSSSTSRSFTPGAPPTRSGTSRLPQQPASIEEAAGGEGDGDDVTLSHHSSEEELSELAGQPPESGLLKLRPLPPLGTGLFAPSNGAQGPQGQLGPSTLPAVGSNGNGLMPGTNGFPPVTGGAGFPGVPGGASAGPASSGPEPRDVNAAAGVRSQSAMRWESLVRKNPTSGGQFVQSGNGAQFVQSAAQWMQPGLTGSAAALGQQPLGGMNFSGLPPPKQAFVGPPGSGAGLFDNLFPSQNGGNGALNGGNYTRPRADSGARSQLGPTQSAVGGSSLQSFPMPFAAPGGMMRNPNAASTMGLGGLSIMSGKQEASGAGSSSTTEMGGTIDQVSYNRKREEHSHTFMDAPDDVTATPQCEERDLSSSTAEDNQTMGHQQSMRLGVGGGAAQFFQAGPGGDLPNSSAPWQLRPRFPQPASGAVPNWAAASQVPKLPGPSFPQQARGRQMPGTQMNQVGAVSGGLMSVGAMGANLLFLQAGQNLVNKDDMMDAMAGGEVSNGAQTRSRSCGASLQPPAALQPFLLASNIKTHGRFSGILAEESAVKDVEPGSASKATTNANTSSKTTTQQSSSKNSSSKTSANRSTAEVHHDYLQDNGRAAGLGVLGDGFGEDETQDCGDEEDQVTTLMPQRGPPPGRPRPGGGLQLGGPMPPAFLPGTGTTGEVAAQLAMGADIPLPTAAAPGQLPTAPTAPQFNKEFFPGLNMLNEQPDLLTYMKQQQTQAITGHMSAPVPPTSHWTFAGINIAKAIDVGARLMGVTGDSKSDTNVSAGAVQWQPPLQVQQEGGASAEQANQLPGGTGIFTGFGTPWQPPACQLPNLNTKPPGTKLQFHPPSTTAGAAPQSKLQQQPRARSCGPAAPALKMPEFTFQRDRSLKAFVATHAGLSIPGGPPEFTQAPGESMPQDGDLSLAGADMQNASNFDMNTGGEQLDNVCSPATDLPDGARVGAVTVLQREHKTLQGKHRKMVDRMGKLSIAYTSAMDKISVLERENAILQATVDRQKTLLARERAKFLAANAVAAIKGSVSSKAKSADARTAPSDGSSARKKSAERATDGKKPILNMRKVGSQQRSRDNSQVMSARSYNVSTASHSLGGADPTSTSASASTSQVAGGGDLSKMNGANSTTSCNSSWAGRAASSLVGNNRNQTGSKGTASASASRVGAQSSRGGPSSCASSSSASGVSSAVLSAAVVPNMITNNIKGSILAKRQNRLVPNTAKSSSNSAVSSKLAAQNALNRNKFGASKTSTSTTSAFITRTSTDNNNMTTTTSSANLLNKNNTISSPPPIQQSQALSAQEKVCLSGKAPSEQSQFSSNKNGQQPSLVTKNTKPFTESSSSSTSMTSNQHAIATTQNKGTSSSATKQVQDDSSLVSKGSGSKCSSSSFSSSSFTTGSVSSSSNSSKQSSPPLLEGSSGTASKESKRESLSRVIDPNDDIGEELTLAPACKSEASRENSAVGRRHDNTDRDAANVDSEQVEAEAPAVESDSDSSSTSSSAQDDESSDKPCAGRETLVDRLEETSGCSGDDDNMKDRVTVKDHSSAPDASTEQSEKKPDASTTESDNIKASSTRPEEEQQEQEEQVQLPSGDERVLKAIVSSGSRPGSKAPTEVPSRRGSTTFQLPDRPSTRASVAPVVPSIVSEKNLASFNARGRRGPQEKMNIIQKSFGGAVAGGTGNSFSGNNLHNNISGNNMSTRPGNNINPSGSFYGSTSNNGRFGGNANRDSGGSFSRPAPGRSNSRFGSQSNGGRNSNETRPSCVSPDENVFEDTVNLQSELNPPDQDSVYPEDSASNACYRFSPTESEIQRAQWWASRPQQEQRNARRTAEPVAEVFATSTAHRSSKLPRWPPAKQPPQRF
ncbi:unnamed protein product [Amoebophrya sp. A25]|nr:unnamed protein product [Amoebophrya sp. A25]|eukprot:GSA25T00024592001.1